MQPGLDVTVDGTGPAALLDRAVFSAVMQDVRPVTIHLVGAPRAALARLAPLLQLADDAELRPCTRIPEGTRRYQTALGIGDVIYPEGWRLLIAAVQANDAAQAEGPVLEAAVRPGAVPYVTAKRRHEPGPGSIHGRVFDRTRPAGGQCRIEAVVGETWVAVV